ncbi:hypothetical protein AB0M47_08665 [Hamadaea sp. NPDC051192]|uniref:hypothetical protein n=1 Tax=Hamadaea sp. NPDC051192 TaxID=3154940 RepID=UPI0034157B5E
MQIHAEDRAVLTVTRDRYDYGKIATVLGFIPSGRRQSLAFSFLVRATLISLHAQQIMGAVTRGAIGVGVLLLDFTAAAGAVEAARWGVRRPSPSPPTAWQ